MASALRDLMFCCGEIPLHPKALKEFDDRSAWLVAAGMETWDMSELASLQRGNTLGESS